MKSMPISVAGIVISGFSRQTTWQFLRTSFMRVAHAIYHFEPRTIANSMIGGYAENIPLGVYHACLLNSLEVKDDRIQPATFVKALARALVARGYHVVMVHCEGAYRLRSREQFAVEGEPEVVGKVHRLRSSFGMQSPLITQQTGKRGVKATQLRTVLDHDFDFVNFHNISLIGDPASFR